MMTRNKQIQIPVQLLIDMMTYLEASEGPQDLKERIWAQIYSKADAMARRDLYSTYKDPSKTPEEREQARLKYLDAIGVPKSFRW